MKIRFKTSTQVWKVISVILLLCGLQFGQQVVSGAEAVTIITFDPPGSTLTQPQALNPNGMITGYYNDVNGVTHGFLRPPHGTIVTFDPTGSSYTQPNGITPEGVITGYYNDANGVSHGFLRAATNGTITSFDYPPFQNMASLSTQAYAINPARVVTGVYVDGNSVSHGFLRTFSALYTSFDPPGYLPGYNQQLYVTAINPAGVVAGWYEDSSFAFHGFFRTPTPGPTGTSTSFDPPGSAYTTVSGISSSGTIIGSYTYSLITGPFHAFLRDHNGTISTIDYPNTNNGTFPYAINSDGKITGNYFNGNQYSGFLRNRNGKYITFDPPGSTITTTPTAINPEGEITGWYYDSGGVQHGFLRHAQDE